MQMKARRLDGSEESPIGNAGPKVLIVDDDADVARAFARILARRGYSTTIAGDGRAALARIEQARVAQAAFDVVVSDVSMPGMSGVDLLAELYRRDPDLPVILISGGGAPLARTLDWVACGASQCLNKPIMADELDRAVLRAAGLRRLALLRRESPELFGDRPNPAGSALGRSPVEWPNTPLRPELQCPGPHVRSGSSEV